MLFRKPFHPHPAQWILTHSNYMKQVCRMHELKAQKEMPSLYISTSIFFSTMTTKHKVRVLDSAFISCWQYVFRTQVCLVTSNTHGLCWHVGYVGKQNSVWLHFGYIQKYLPLFYRCLMTVDHITIHPDPMIMSWAIKSHVLNNAPRY